MYHILFSTPPYQNSNFLPHLLEHCILSDFFSEYCNFLKYYEEIEANTYNFYTQFSFSSQESLERFLPLLSQKISETAYDKELGRIQDEMLTPTASQELFDLVQINNSQLSNNKNSLKSFFMIIK